MLQSRRELGSCVLRWPRPHMAVRCWDRVDLCLASQVKPRELLNISVSSYHPGWLLHVSQQREPEIESPTDFPWPGVAWENIQKFPAHPGPHWAALEKASHVSERGPMGQKRTWKISGQNQRKKILVDLSLPCLRWSFYYQEEEELEIEI